MKFELNLICWVTRSKLCRVVFTTGNQSSCYYFGFPHPESFSNLLTKDLIMLALSVVLFLAFIFS